MGFTYNGFFSVDFIVDNVTYNTHNSWGLVPLKKPVVKPPSISRDGQLTPGSNSWEFALSHMEDDDETYITYLEIVDAVNGKRCKVRLHYSDHDSTLYKEYTGSVTVSDFSTDDSYSTISFDCDLVSDEGTEKMADKFANRYALWFTIRDTLDPYPWKTNSWGENGWKLQPDKRPTVDSPKPRTNYVTTPGANGSLDLSEVLSGGNGVYYDNAEGEWTFRIADEHYDYAEQIFNEVVETLNGKVATVQTLNGNGKIYNGRFTVSGIDIGTEEATFKIGYIIDPYAVETHPVPPEGGVIVGQIAFRGVIVTPIVGEAEIIEEEAS